LSPSEKLTGDFADGLGAILIGELSLASFFSKNHRLVFWDFCNKIGTELPSRDVRIDGESWRVSGRTADIRISAAMDWSPRTT